MTSSNRSGDALRALCAQVYEDDGAPMRRDSGSSRSNQPSRKDLQVCKQAMRALNGAISGEAVDAVLIELAVIAVTPDPDATRLRVTVRPSRAVEQRGASVILGALKRSRGFLHEALARELSRKRVPTLVFELAPSEEADT